VTEDLLRGADLVLVMEQEHQDALRETYPGLSERVHLLTSMAGDRGDVEDPIGLPLERVQRLVEDLERWLNAGWPRIRALARPNDAFGG
jgi:protein-tyrosine-phosphatase